MKNNKYLFFGTLIMGMALVSVLTGCATTVESGTPPAPDKQAAQLAADLNTIKAGSAVVDGAKVTLSGEVQITTSLTVPAGVTLDLTADGMKFELQNGAELTVNGTVNASGHGNHGSGWVEGGLRIGNGTTVINGSGTINLKSKGLLLGPGQGSKLTLDGVTLVGLKDNDMSLVGVGEGGELVLKSGAITGNTRIRERWTGGGGVTVERGTFTMEGGEISGNSAQSSGDNAGGGGVTVENGVFTMKGGKISGNSINGSVGGRGQGGGVAYSGTFTMTGGEISGNTADSGAGVFPWVGTFTKSGGTIYGDTDSVHTAGSTENTAKDGTTHAVGLGDGKVRSLTAGPEVKLYAKKIDDKWTYNDTSAGGIGDTTANWVENGQ
ncbi:hypothetical protein FACS189476_09080 [Spirochaetia bacterium]|nr:hypothetical protein FACS189476_09080 [Spirochaetia bacterium]